MTVPAPKYLNYDSWFGEPVLSEGQMQDKLKERLVEEKSIHQIMYEYATGRLARLGGSEEIGY
tara:strand:+ start:2305 stop:2493 length:189 start_codon:yes stop_codon:yes gene_type:complete